MADRRYRAFISYSHRDKRIANWLHSALETYRLPPKAVAEGKPARLHPIFKDREELPAADSLGEAIEQAIRCSDALIVLCSPAAAQSPWIAREVDLYKRINGDHAVFPVIVEGDPPGNFPAPLLQRYENGEPTDEAAEPIAADLRRHADGRKLGKLKLVAGLAGVDLDGLVQRDAARRQRRLALVAAASVVGMVGTSGLALFAIDQRNDAREQRAEADGLIEYMLTDLRQQLEPVGRLDLLDGVGNRAMDYYARQKLEDLSASELGRRVRAVQLVAEVQNLRGDNEGALPAFQQAARTTEELLARKPDDPERLFNHGQSLFWVGYVAWQHGKMEEARSAMERYADISSRLAAMDRNNLEWQMEEAYSLSNLGTMDFEEGKLRSALDLFERSKDMTGAVARAEGNPSARRKEFGEAHSWISTTQVLLGEVEKAEETRRAEIEIYDRIIAEEPGHNEARRARMYAISSLGRILALKGRKRDADRILEEAIRESEEQIAADPEDTLVKELARGALRDRALIAWSDGNAKLARDLYSRAEELQASLQERDPKNHDWNVTSPGELAMYRALTDQLDSRPAALRALSNRWLSRLDRANPEHEWLHVASYLLAGLAAQREGDRQAARESFSKAFSYPDAEGERVDVRSLALRAAAAERMGRTGDAEAIRQRLRKLGIDPIIDDMLGTRS
ncbi:toll/interleukin-1 receptor domain-containing protein [Qipengyuania vesicularis]|uniref:toll/interleukin-1 receptor domain-containing protein n=1 Tax=Qipengyuania vesicularis TaxID=2867232 RepID=UPI001C8854F8|nr:toll/interleukin-1 receptor domain-containing protein [Qipengyuania vesicularis]MBX7528054.1 toll/interleukin-1 receptor domain-containing protein [Qipengyuania vesicularis]